MMAQYTLTKSFSNESCRNACGKKLSKCSCTNDCTVHRNCCSDFQICNDIQFSAKYSCQSTVSFCQYCKSDTECMQCFDGYFFKNGECKIGCGVGDKVINTNKICLTQKCVVENCLACTEDLNKCNNCDKSYFLYKNQCLKECPLNTIADRISQQCLPPTIKSFYFIYPTKSSCKNNCGKQMKNLSNECSCHSSCLKNATCCYDIHMHCPSLSYWN